MEEVDISDYLVLIGADKKYRVDVVIIDVSEWSTWQIDHAKV